MTERQTLEAILAQWKPGWEALHPADTAQPTSVPWTTDNEPYTSDQLGVLGAWARVTIKHSTRVQATQGEPHIDEVRGQIFVQLFGPVGTGMGMLADLAKDARNVLRGRIGSLNLRAGATQDGAEDGRWAMKVVVVPFRYEDV